jgi:predicted nucleic acid-binding protein
LSDISQLLADDRSSRVSVDSSVERASSDVRSGAATSQSETHDALYVALAAALDGRLITSDRWLAARSASVIDVRSP